ncbi:MAG: CinA family protein [Clostridia bacterium]|nr:CinA family protein [Clostridia bacterium]
MKNACVIFGIGKDVTAVTRVTAVTDAFFCGGYSFDETRIYAEKDGAKLEKFLKESAEFDNVLLLTDRNSLDWVKPYLQKSFQETESDGKVGVYTAGTVTLFLLSGDERAAGEDYVKNVCLPYLQKKQGTRLDRMVIRAVGANQTYVESLLAKAKGMAGTSLSCYHRRKADEDVIEIVYGSNTPKMLIDDVLRVFAEGLGESVYALDDTPLEEQLIRLLKLRERKISVAESFTGGGIAQRLVSVPGASEVYFEGLNTYHELSKMKRLGVTEYTLKTAGAVSDQTAYEMAMGLINTGDCDISIATTGLAGPNTDKSMLPVGLCYIAIGLKEKVLVYRYKFDGSRSEIKEKTINYALFLAYKQLKNI